MTRGSCVDIELSQILISSHTEVWVDDTMDSSFGLFILAVLTLMALLIIFAVDYARGNRRYPIRAYHAAPRPDGKGVLAGSYGYDVSFTPGIRGTLPPIPVGGWTGFQDIKRERPIPKDYDCATPEADSSS